MKEIADLLRKKREEQNISLQEISKQTKIQVRLLEALESGDPTPFAGDVYVKGALRSYADIVGLDDKEIIKAYNDWRKGSEDVDEGNTKIFLPGKDFHLNVPSIPIILALIIIAVGAWYFFSDQPAEDSPEVAMPDNGENLIGENDDYGTEEIEEYPEQEEMPEPLMSLIEESSKEATFTLSNIDTLQAELVFVGPCWVDIYLDGDKYLENRYENGEQLSLEAAETIWIRFGNPGAVNLRVNGLEVPGFKEINVPYNLTFRKN
ncbi:MAG: DUF4115 domain-containing protein [Firmicutes bacterium]|nr:DUF4115 domain-containing protein [Bacillota bacterium]